LESKGTSEKTAFITGASSGIGAEFARQLAARGYQLYLTARRADRLQQLSAEIQSRFPVQTHILPADLSVIYDIDVLVSTITSLPPLDLLVNNAGFGTVGRFYHVDPEKVSAMVNVHMVALVRLCRAALPGMVSQNKGGIINVSSLAGLVPIRNVLYHSSKAFQISFSEALRSELYSTQVRVQALCPGFVLTEFHDSREYMRFSRQSIPGFLWMSSEKVVTESLNLLPKGNLICAPGIIYHFAAALSRNSITSGLIKYVAGLIVHRRQV
jgi:uncharacterized protein